MFITNLVLGAAKAFSEWRGRNRAYAEMMALNDHALADIGIERSQIRSLIYADPAPARPMRSAPTRPHLAWRKPA